MRGDGSWWAWSTFELLDLVCHLDLICRPCVWTEWLTQADWTNERGIERTANERAGTERWRKRAAAEAARERERERDPVVALVSPVDWERAREFGREGSAYGGSRFAVREGRQEGAHAVGGRVPFSIVTMPHIVDSWLKDN